MNKVYWIESSEGRGYKKLDRDIQVDYLIIGAGLQGLPAFIFWFRQDIKRC